MRRPIRLLVGAGVLVAVAFVAAYFLFFNDDSPPELQLTPTDETASTVTPTSDIDGKWVPASSSVAGYRVREKLARLPAKSDAVGRTNDVTGTVLIAGTTVTSADITVDVTTLKSEEDRRDNKIRSSGLETDTFETATFALTEPIDLSATDTVTVDATGDLTIHGVTKSVTIPIQAKRNGEELEVVGSITFPFSDFEMTPPSIGGFVTVDDDATMEFQLFLDRES
jgi:polyisoprenoid-binding protein YceI